MVKTVFLYKSKYFLLIPSIYSSINFKNNL